MKKQSSMMIASFVIAAVIAVMSCMYTPTTLAQPQKPEQPEEELFTFIREVNPDMAEHLAKVRAVDPNAYREILGGVANQYRELKKLEATNPEAGKKAIEVAKLEGQIQVLARHYKGSTTPEEKEELRKKIKDMLTEAIDGKITLEESRVAYIEKDLKSLKDRIAQRKQHKDKIVEQKLTEVTSEDYLRW